MLDTRIKLLGVECKTRLAFLNGMWLSFKDFNLQLHVLYNTYAITSSNKLTNIKVKEHRFDCSSTFHSLCQFVYIIDEHTVIDVLIDCYIYPSTTLLISCIKA